jgi:hypothetical protein
MIKVLVFDIYKRQKKYGIALDQKPDVGKKSVTPKRK